MKSVSENFLVESECFFNKIRYALS